MQIDDIKISNEIKEKIVRLHIEPNYERTVVEAIELIKYFRRFGIAFETISKFFVGVGSVISFAAGIYKSKIMSFVSGTVSVVSLVFLQYSTFSIKESKKHTADLNIILKKLNLEGIPVTTQDYDHDNRAIASSNIKFKEEYEEPVYTERPPSPSFSPVENNGNGKNNFFGNILKFIFRN